ncbi:HD-GYP domain-containing protein [Paenibacillus albiflavus]|uniref:HD-GYP domain-containing protein n=1 Tax=Paenibacillus albiflavus TaxID=2545760 RepID=A0A4R4E995_9BACL|nr:HD-GYP domain-containing protein [Paenibacillus albiflavus]TCZ76139.1 HD-GYP domain-containing protein [Paenibacillus albiflavus]
MRLLPINMCQPGMRLHQNIYSADGVILLAENVELTEHLIKRLQTHGITNIYVQDHRTDDIEIHEPLRMETKAKVLVEIRSSFRKMMYDTNSDNRHTYSFLGKKFREVFSLILDDISDHREAMSLITNICVMDSHLYQHSMNVCVYTSLLGIAQGYSREELYSLGLGSLLHDVGKVKIPKEILFKPGKLTDEEFKEIQKHTTYGFKMLKDEANIPLISAHCAFQHHERMNGSGYPRGIGGDDIHEYAQWIGIVDSFDAMTSQRVYRQAKLPHYALDILMADAGTLYDKQKVEVFRNKIAIYPIGMTVALSTGEVGVVVDLNNDYLHRPIVRILQDQDGQDLHAPYEIDLSKHLSLMVTEVNPTSGKMA